jgi:CRISPR-associated protein (TIGR02710 family)
MESSTLLVSVGGTPAPVIFSIRHCRPERVIFFVSPGSRGLVTEAVLPALLQDPGRLPDHEFVVTPDEQDLGESVLTLLREVPLALRRLGRPSTETWPGLVDYTAGTKTMSAALILASSKHPCRVIYIGTDSPLARSKGGLGIVLDGRDKAFLQENPWNRIAWVEVRAAVELFNRGQYGNAAGVVRSVLDKVDDPTLSRLYQVLAEIFEGFHRWDIFQHEDARRFLGRNLQPLADLAQTQQVVFPELEAFAVRVRELHEILSRIQPRQLSWDIIHDLLANARRRADLEHKYEDAVARCYAAIERIAQHRLRFAHGIDPGGVPAEQLPESAREGYRVKYEVTDRHGRRVLRFGAVPALELLKTLEDDVGKRFAAIGDRLRSHLDQRNRSILAHGFDPMDRAKFEALFADALELLGVPESDLWQFPRLEL